MRIRLLFFCLLAGDIRFSKAYYVDFRIIETLCAELRHTECAYYFQCLFILRIHQILSFHLSFTPRIIEIASARMGLREHGFVRIRLAAVWHRFRATRMKVAAVWWVNWGRYVSL